VSRGSVSGHARRGTRRRIERSAAVEGEQARFDVRCAAPCSTRARLLSGHGSEGNPLLEWPASLFESLLKAQTKKVLTKSSLGEILRQDLCAELGLTSPDVRETDFNAMVINGMQDFEALEVLERGTRRPARKTKGPCVVRDGKDRASDRANTTEGMQ
jgi:hypothetical protein